MILQLTWPTGEDSIEGTPPPWGWLITRSCVSGYRHGVPTWDLREHVVSERCWCEPALDEWGVVAHNALDGRERYEQGRARRH